MPAMQRSRSALSVSRQSSRDSCVSPPRQRQTCHEVDGAQSTAVRVVVRFRPLLPGENDAFSDDPAFVVDSGQNRVETRDLKHRFQFDRVFDQETVQPCFCAEIALPLAKDVIQGHNGTILAYGPTGGGKTYSMFGPQGQHTVALQGLVPRAADHIFKYASTCHIECSFLEVYNEQLRDLLTSSKSILQVKESPNKGFWVDGLTHTAVSSTAEVLLVLRSGLKQRAAANTRLNQHSSRSHAIFTLEVVQHIAEGNVQRSKLTLVDLAGSEKVKKSGSSGETLEEAKKINSSLSALGHVIDALAEKRPHVPYRDSRLTRLLEDSLGGNCRTTLVVACSPADVHSTETLSALRFAARAKKVYNMVHLPRTYEDRQLANRIISLRLELAKAQQELAWRVDQGKFPRESQKALLRSLSSLPECEGETPALESCSSLAGGDASREEFAGESRRDSDSASTAIGSGSSLAVGLAESESETRFSSWDAGDFDLGGQKAQLPVAAAAIIGTLEAALSGKDEASRGKDGSSSSEGDPIPGTVHIQQALSWELELERHRRSALSYELGKHVQENMGLRRQVLEAERQAQSRAPGFSTPSKARLSSNVPAIPYNYSPKPVTVAEGATIVTTTTTTVHTSVRISTPLRRTGNHSPLRSRDGSYGSGLQSSQPNGALWY